MTLAFRKDVAMEAVTWTFANRVNFYATLKSLVSIHVGHWHLTECQARSSTSSTSNTTQQGSSSSSSSSTTTQSGGPAEPSDSTKTTTTTPKDKSTTTKTDDNSPDLGLILGASLGGAAFVVIVGVGIFMFYRYRRPSDPNGQLISVKNPVADDANDGHDNNVGKVDDVSEIPTTKPAPVSVFFCFFLIKKYLYFSD